MPPPIPPPPASTGSGLWEEVRDFVLDASAGTVGGVLGVMAGNPLDVVKTRMQAGRAAYASTLACLRGIMRTEGVRGLYKGSLVASLGQAPNNFLTFGHYGFAMRVLERLSPPPPPPPGGGPAEPRLAHVYLAGSWAGAAQSVALAPFEHIKVQQQLIGEAGGRKEPLTLMEATRTVYRAGGLFRGLMRGWVATAMRDVPTFGLYFAAFEGTKAAYVSYARSQLAPGDATAVTVPNWVLLAGGAAAGVASWLFAVPADVIKSNIQGSPLSTPRHQLRFLTMARSLYAKHGARVFVRGLIPCIVRSIPVNAVTFAVYELTLAELRDVTGLSLPERIPEDVMR